MSVGELDSNNKFNVTSDVVLTAQWEEIYYTVTIYPNGGTYNNSTEPDVKAYRAGYELTIGTPTRDTYKFAGWTAEPDILGQDNKLIVTSDVVITANWEEIYYTLTIDPNDGVYGEHNSAFTTEYRAGRVIPIDTPARDTYLFSGWSVQGSPIENDSITLNSNTIITAQWGEIMHTLTIRPNGGTYGDHDEEFSTSYHEGDAISILTPERNTYRFTGWTEEGDSVVNNEIILTQDTIITANWEEIYYTLTIDPNGGIYDEHTGIFSDSYRADSYATLLTPSKTGCDFAYWKLEDNSRFTGDSIQMTRNITLVAQYNDQYFDVTVDPNGGKFNNKTEVFHDRVKYGTVIDLTNTEYTDHEIRDWTKDSTETLPADTAEITITANTNLVINWWSSIFYTITINPNEGTYRDSAEVQEFQARKDEPFTVEEATRERYALSQWTFEDDSVLGTNPFIVNGDHTLTAHWFLAIAKNKRTGKLYPSIMTAHDEANPGNITGDTIILLTDTTEVVTNTKEIILDLNEHTVTGYITNTASGNLTLINGEINNYSSPIISEDNPSHAAVINNGVLTMGIDDYTSDGTVNILRSNIRLIGTEIGLLQNNEFYFYDGFIEGDIGLDGGYDGSPFYRNTFDDTIIYYFPLVTHNDIKDCQHVELMNADRAVSKTIEHGDIYYYNLQDNINTSAKTGYQIYAIRNFDASYPITVAEGNDITFDLDGYVVSAGDDWTIDGTLTVTDSKASEETGSLRASRPITNNNELIFTNAKATTLSANTLINNNKNLTLTNSSLSSEYGYTLEISESNTKLTMDEDSYILTNAKDIYVIRNTSADFIIDGGNIAGRNRVIKNEKNAKLTVKSGNIYSSSTTNERLTLNTISNSGKLSIEGGKIFASATEQSQSSTETINHVGQDLTITGGKIACDSIASSAICINDAIGKTTISGGKILATAKNAATAFDSENSNNTVLGGTISATSTNGTARAILNSAKITISGGNITSTANSSSESTAVRNSYSSYCIINGNATVRAYSNGGIASGVYVYSSDGSIISAGDIYGDTYGLQTNGSTYKSTIGINDTNEDGESILTSVPIIKGGQYGVYSGDISFFDGIISGGVNAVTENAINQIPHDASQKTAEADGFEKTWLEHEEYYLLVDEKEYNSLTLAYEAAKNSTSETKLITVTKNHTTNAAMPTIEKNQDITINLNGFTIQYTQTLINNGKLTITDKDNTNVGTFENINSISTPAITNVNTLTQNGGTIKGRYVAIRSTYTYSIARNTYLYLNTGKAVVENPTDSGIAAAISCSGYSSETLDLSVGYSVLVTTKNATPRAIQSCNNTTVNGGTITVNTESSGSNPSAIYDGIVTLKSGTITVKSTKGVYGIYGNPAVIEGGTITVTSTGGDAYGIHSTGSKLTVTGGTITANSTNKAAYGVKNNNGGGNRGSFEMTGGTIIARTESGTATGASLADSLITGGSITGDTYGIDGAADSNIITLGVDDETISNGVNAIPHIESRRGEYAIKNGYVNFYDGVLVGTNPYTTDTVKAIPDGAVFHNETISGTNHCWLKYGNPYLRIEGKDDYYSLTAAYEDADNGDTIKVIDDYVTQADLPANPAGRTITIDLNDHHLSYYQSLTNEGTMIIVDNGTDPDKVGILENVNPVKTATVQNGTANIKDAKLEIQGGIITSSEETILNYGTLEVFDGEINSTNTTTNIVTTITNKGTVKIPSDASSPIIKATKTTNGSATAINGGTTEINKGTIIAESTSSDAKAISGNVTISGGTVSAEASSGVAYGIHTNGGTATVTGGTITANSTNSVAYGVSVSYGVATVTNGTITATGKNNTYGIQANDSSSSRGEVQISGGIITATSSNGTAYGTTAGAGNITGGKIHGGTYGLYVSYRLNEVTIGDNTDNTLSITSPEIIGDTYAVYGGSINFYDGVIKGELGTNSGAYFDNNIKQIADNTTVFIGSEMINGTEYEVKYLIASRPVAIINETDDYNSLYEAVEASVPGDVIRLKEDNYVFHKIVVDPDQEVTINLNGHTIVSGNQITNNGKLTITDDNPSAASVIDHHETDAFINNVQAKNSSVNPELTLENLEIHAYDVVKNSSVGTVSVKNSKLYGDYNTSASAIEGSGTVKITDNSYIYAKYRAIFLSDGNLKITKSKVESSNTYNHSAVTMSRGNYTIDNSEIKNESYSAISGGNASSNSVIKNNSTIRGTVSATGTLSILSSTVTQTANYNSGSLVSTDTDSSTLILTNSVFSRTQNGSGSSCTSSNSIYGDGLSLIQSKGDMTATNITLHHNYADSNSCAMSYIKNTGTATINGLTIDNDDSAANSTARRSTGIVNSGQMTLKNADITINRAISYGIYTLSGELTLLSTEVNINGTTVYGAYIDNGDLIMGTPEPVDSPNYGTEYADVSVTDPSITAIGTTTGIGVYKNVGKFKYYDGIITGSTSAIPRDKITSEVEHLYEPTFHTDLNGRDVCILTWMREQPSQPSESNGD